MRKWILGVGALALVVASTFVAAPAGAEHNAEGTITVAGVDVACSGEGDVQGDGICTWTAQDKDGWVGVNGPFTITWTESSLGAGDGGLFACAADADLGTCNSPDPDPINPGSVVTTDGTGGGTFAAGDADEHDA